MNQLSKGLPICLVIFFVFACSTSERYIKTETSRGVHVQSKIKPNRLKVGDTVGLVAPGSYISKKQLNEAIQNIEKLGFKVKYNQSILAKKGYLAGSDSVRAHQINTMFADRSVNAIMAVRGGYGCARILPLLDYELIKHNPKILIGYSDITSLLYGVYSKTKMVCYHGPVGTSTFNKFSVHNMLSIISDNSKNFVMKNLPADDKQIYVIKNGVSEGELVGGNLSIVVSMIGTEYDIDTKDKIIFLEDIGEEPYRIDRMLTQMIESGKFDECAGVALGVFRNCEIDKNSPEFENSLTLREVITDRLGKLNVPVIYGLSFGHIINKFTLPFGINAKLDTYNKKIIIMENSVN